MGDRIRPLGEPGVMWPIALTCFLGGAGLIVGAIYAFAVGKAIGGWICLAGAVLMMALGWFFSPLTIQSSAERGGQGPYGIFCFLTALCLTGGATYASIVGKSLVGGAVSVALGLALTWLVWVAFRPWRSRS